LHCQFTTLTSLRLVRFFDTFNLEFCRF
jgi:hypothetical protein